MADLAIGTAQFGFDYGINNKNGKIAKNIVFDIITLALKNNISTFETAFSYGESEKILGSYIKKTNAPLKIISKLPNCKGSDVTSIINKSLEKLNQERIFGYLIHAFSDFDKDNSIYEELEKNKNSGKIEKIGFSLYFPYELEKILSLGIIPDIIQVPFSIFDQRFLKYLPKLRKMGTKIYTRSVFLQGIVFKKEEEIPDFFLNIKPKITKINKTAKELDIELSQIYLCFTLLTPNIDNVIIGVDNINDLDKNINSVNNCKKVNLVYDKLLEMKEENENILLPFRWKI